MCIRCRNIYKIELDESTLKHEWVVVGKAIRIQELVHIESYLIKNEYKLRF
jgi:hypothetical protein